MATRIGSLNSNEGNNLNHGVTRNSSRIPLSQMSDDAWNKFMKTIFSDQIMTYEPLGLKLTITPELCKEVSLVLDRATNVKKPFSAAKFDILSLQIGNWKKSKDGLAEGIVGKFQYSRKKILWEVLDGTLKKRIEIPFSQIEAIAFAANNELGELKIQLIQPPEFAREVKPQAKKPTQWDNTDVDFTNDQALIYRRHVVKCAPGILDEHYEKLLGSDSDLLERSRRPFPTEQDPMFSRDEAPVEHCNLSVSNSCGEAQQNPLVQHRCASFDGYSQQNHGLTNFNAPMPVPMATEMICWEETDLRSHLLGNVPSDPDPRLDISISSSNNLADQPRNDMSSKVLDHIQYRRYEAGESSSVGGKLEKRRII